MCDFSRVPHVLYGLNLFTKHHLALPATQPSPAACSISANHLRPHQQKRPRWAHVPHRTSRTMFTFGAKKSRPKKEPVPPPDLRQHRSSVQHNRCEMRRGKVNSSCCTLRPRTTPFPEENSIPGVIYGVLLLADMNAATPLGSRGRSVISSGTALRLPRLREPDPPKLPSDGRMLE